MIDPSQVFKSSSLNYVSVSSDIPYALIVIQHSGKTLTKILEGFKKTFIILYLEPYIHMSYYCTIANKKSYSSFKIIVFFKNKK